MRIVRICTVVLFVVCLTVYIWVTVRYNQNHDTQGPVLTCQEELLELSASDDKASLMQGLTASDAQDGDLTDQILLFGKSYFLEPGLFEAEYVVFDAHQNYATLTRKIRYTDYTPPRFELTQPLEFIKGSNIRYLDYVTAQDVLDGDITDKIQVLASDVSNYTAGVYPVLLEVTNSYGDTVQVELMVVVREKGRENADVILKENLTYITSGAEFDPYQLISSVTADDGTSLRTDKVQVLGSVDTQTPGCYPLLFSYEEDGYAGKTYLTVVVCEEVAQ